VHVVSFRVRQGGPAPSDKRLAAVPGCTPGIRECRPLSDRSYSSFNIPPPALAHHKKQPSV